MFDTAIESLLNFQQPEVVAHPRKLCQPTQSRVEVSKLSKFMKMAPKSKVWPRYQYFLHVLQIEKASCWSIQPK